MRNRRIFARMFSFIPLLITLFMLQSLPDKIPAHYDFNGNVTRYGSKYEMLILPITTILMGLFWLLIGNVVRKNKEKSLQNTKILFWGDIIMTLTFTMLTIWFLYMSLHKP